MNKLYPTMKLKTIATCTALSLALSVSTLQAQDSIAPKSRLTIGGYGEAVYTRNFYNNHFNRYKFPAQYKDGNRQGRVDLPHVVVNLGYDFGKGWSMGSEIEFEHGGNEVAIELEDDEAGEYEHEIERGGEVALEQFWIQKSFGKGFNIRLGHIIVPVGQTNNAHLPTQFFTCYRPEGEMTIMPCTWHETGISLWGRLGNWRYEAVVVPALNSDMFTNSGWVHNGSASAYEFKVANNLAAALRIDNYSIKNFHWALSGYVGNSFNNDIETYVTDEAHYTNSQGDTVQYKYYGVKGTVAIGTAEFDYKGHGLVVRGNLDYGYLSDANKISMHNKSQYNSSQSPFPHSLVADAALATGLEVGYDLFHPLKKQGEQKLYLFGRYDYYDSYILYHEATDYEWTDRHVITLGVNYYPIKQVVIKAEYAKRFLKAQYNDEPMFSLGVAYSGFFTK
jgi:hypothetical protein